MLNGRSKRYSSRSFQNPESEIVAQTFFPLRLLLTKMRMPAWSTSPALSATTSGKLRRAQLTNLKAAASRRLFHPSSVERYPIVASQSVADGTNFGREKRDRGCFHSSTWSQAIPKRRCNKLQNWRSAVSIL